MYFLKTFVSVSKAVFVLHLQPLWLFFWLCEYNCFVFYEVWTDVSSKLWLKLLCRLPHITVCFCHEKFQTLDFDVKNNSISWPNPGFKVSDNQSNKLKWCQFNFEVENTTSNPNQWAVNKKFPSRTAF